MKISSFFHFSFFDSSFCSVHVNDYSFKAAEGKAINGKWLRWNDRWTLRGDSRSIVDLKEHSQHSHFQYIMEPRSWMGWRSSLCSNIVLLDIFIKTYEIHAFVSTFNVNITRIDAIQIVNFIFNYSFIWLIAQLFDWESLTSLQVVLKAFVVNEMEVLKQ